MKILRLILPSLVLFLASCDKAPSPVALSGATRMASCLGIEIPVETEASIAGVYEGATSEEAEGNLSEQVVRPVKLTGQQFALPQILVLSSYEPVLWDVSALPAAMIRGIVVYSYIAGSNVNGAASGVPVKRIWADDASNGETTGDVACGSAHYVYKGGPDLDALADDVERTTGSVSQRFVGAYSPTTLDLNGPPVQGKDGDEPFSRQSDISPGAERLAPLVDRGDVRLADAEDIAAWNAVTTAALKTGKLAPYRHPRLYTGNTYVALRPFNIPDGMYGAHSRSFIIPKGMEPPANRASHNTYFFMGTGKCSGTASECE